MLEKLTGKCDWVLCDVPNSGNVVPRLYHCVSKYGKHECHSILSTSEVVINVLINKECRSFSFQYLIIFLQSPKVPASFAAIRI
jgi:hypothetical protein